jgi:hypothetical protein
VRKEAAKIVAAKSKPAKYVPRCGSDLIFQACAFSGLRLFRLAPFQACAFSGLHLFRLAPFQACAFSGLKNLLNRPGPGFIMQMKKLGFESYLVKRSSLGTTNPHSKKYRVR